MVGTRADARGHSIFALNVGPFQEAEATQLESSKA